ncbi:hypothetical protein ACMFMG_007605 [Clarireedia jacksonii]
MCWMHGLLGGCCCIGVVLTALQRARIRAQYRINGHFGYDCFSAIFCHPCTLAQNDREVRAREGAVELAKRTEMFGQPQMSQPKLQQPMRYASPRVTDAENLELRENRIFRQEGKKLQKRYAKIADMKEIAAEPERESNVSVAEASRNLEQSEVMGLYVGHIGGRSDGGGSSRRPESRGSFSSLSNCSTVVYESPQSTVKVKQHSLRGCEKIRPSGMQQLSYVHDFTDSHVTKSVLDYYEEEEKYLQQFGIGRSLITSTIDAEPSKSTMQHALDDCAAKFGLSCSTASTVRQHRLTTCEVVDPAQSATLSQHPIEECDLESAGSSSQPGSSKQHRFSSSAARSGQGGKNSMSPSRASSPVMQLPRDQQQLLKDCPPLMSSFSTPLLREHSLESCNIPDSIQACEEHLLDNCELESTSASPARPRQHRFASCSILDLSESSSPKPIKQHRIASCSALSPSSSSKNSATLDNASTISASSTPHKLKQCCSISCIAQSPIPETEEHFLVDCAGNSGNASPVKQHAIADCDARSEIQEEKQHLLAQSAGDSGPATPLKQHRIVSCVVSSASSSKHNSLLGHQHRLASCPALIPEKKTMSHVVGGNQLVDVGNNDQTIGRHSYTDFLHNLDDCLTPAQRVKREADEKKGLMQGDKDREAQVAERGEVRISDYASHESDLQYSLAQVLALSHENGEIGQSRDGTVRTMRGDKKGKGKDKGKKKEKAKGSERSKKMVDSEGSGVSAFASYFGFNTGKKTDE